MHGNRPKKHGMENKASAEIWTNIFIANIHVCSMCFVGCTHPRTQMSVSLSASLYSTSGVIISQLRPIFLFTQFPRIFSRSPQTKTHFSQPAKAHTFPFDFLPFFRFCSCFWGESFFSSTRSQRIANAQTRWFDSEYAMENRDSWKWPRIMAKNGMASSLAPITYFQFYWEWTSCLAACHMWFVLEIPVKLQSRSNKKHVCVFVFDPSSQLLSALC